MIYTKVIASLAWTENELGHPFWIRVWGCFGEDKGLPIAAKTKINTIKILRHIVKQLLSPSPFQFLNPESKAPRKRKFLCIYY